MKKLILLLITCSLFLTTVHAQSWLWAKGAVLKNTNGSGELRADHPTAADRFGNFCMTGMFGDTISFGSFTLHSKTGAMFLTKYDSNGNVLWASQSVSASLACGAIGYSVAIDAWGNTYVTGEFQDTITLGAFTLKNSYSNPNEAVVFLAKYDKLGNVVWAKQSNSLSKYTFGIGVSVAVDASANVYVTGYFGGNLSFGTFILTDPNPTTGFVVKYDSSGNVLWAHQAITNSGSLQPYSIAVDAGSNAYITGEFGNKATIGSQTLTSGSFIGDLFLAKYDPAGNFLWAKQSTSLTYTSVSAGYSISVDRYNNAYILGTVSDTVAFGPFTLQGGWGHCILAKYDSAGNVLWVEKDNSPNPNWWGLSITSDTLKEGGGYFVATAGDTSHYYKLVFGSDTFNFYTPHYSATTILHFDSAGNVLCGTVFSEGDGDNGDGVAVDHSGKFIYVGGDIWSSSIVVLGSDTLLDIGYETPFAARWQDCGNSLKAFIKPISSPSCNGLCNGQATAYPYGSIPPYTYKWSTGATTQSVFGLCAASYYVVVTDSLGNKDTLAVTITQPAPLVAGISTIKNVLCNGGNSGSITASCSGGTSPYSYAWSNGQKTITATNLSVGTYTVTITDSHGCADITSATITEPPALTGTPSVIANVSCNAGKDGSAGITASGGTSPYTYKWANGQTSSLTTGLSAGTYTVSVTDSNKCKTTDTVTIIEPTILNISVSSINTVCPFDSGKATAFASGGTGAFTYNWAPSGGTNSVASALSAGTYTVTATDANGCTITSSAMITITGIPTNTACCSQAIINGQSVTLYVVPADTSNSYVWSPSLGLSCTTCPSPIASPNVSTTYYVIITNSLGCSTTDTVFIDVSQHCDIFVPTAFSPNNDSQNDILYIKGDCINTVDFIIFDRWGNKVFESENMSEGWDGNYKGQPMNAGTYVYYLKAVLNDGSPVEKKGNISLVR